MLTKEQIKSRLPTTIPEICENRPDRIKLGQGYILERSESHTNTVHYTMPGIKVVFCDYHGKDFVFLKRL